ncbi:hypothetical protein AAVH_37632, partial [Aphelenchoides avenae]
MKAADGEDFYDSDEDEHSDEDRRLCEFAGDAQSCPQTDSAFAASITNVEEKSADDDFVARYDGWEEDVEDIIIIPDEGDEIPFAHQNGGFHGFDTSDDEDEDVGAEAGEDVEVPAGLEQYYEFVQTRRRWDLERIDDVMALVEDIVQHLINKATHNADREGFQGWIGFGLKTEDGKQWYIPFRDATQNTAQKIARSIEKYDQSSNTTVFYGKRVTFDITVINEPRGAGGRKGTVITKHLNTNMANIVKIPIDGRDCLAGAVVASLYYYTYEEVMRAEPDKDANPDKFQIVIFSEKRGIAPIRKGDVANSKHHVYIYLHDKHYDVMKSPERFFGLRNYCVSCEVKFAKPEEHSRLCGVRCPDCLRMGHGYPCKRDTEYDDPKYDGFDYDENGDRIERGPFPCRECQREFVSKDCFEAHKKIACKTFHRCGFCTNVYRVRNHKKNGGHRCGERFCRLCKAFHSKKNGCYIRPIVSKEVTDYRVVALDFECDITLKTDDPKKKRHRPNYAVVMVTCTQCMDKTGQWSNLDCTDCEICGPVKHKTFSDWAMNLPAEYKTFCYAHNGAKYDVQFVIDGMCKRGGQLPSITSNGNKIMQVWCRRSKQNNEVIFRDSCLMFPMKLDDAPEAFELGIDAKQFFPYRYNTPANYDRPLKGLPPMDDYIPSAMSDEKRAKFAEWWAAENAKQLDFDLKAQLKEYCTNDVWILLNALYKYRELINLIADGDIFWKVTTQTSAALSIFKKKYVKEKQLAIVPNNGYGRQERQSAKGMKFLKWFAHAHGIEVQHRDSEGGERKVEGTNYRLDGYIAAEAKQSAGYQPCDWQHCLFCAKDFDGHIALEFNG